MVTPKRRLIKCWLGGLCIELAGSDRDSNKAQTRREHLQVHRSAEADVVVQMQTQTRTRMQT